MSIPPHISPSGQSPKSRLPLGVAAALLLASSVLASTPLFDFEKKKERDGVSVCHRPDKTICFTNAYATSGKTCLHFRAAPWHSGNDEWPGFTLAVEERDWTKYDRLVLDLVNVGDAGDRLGLYIASPSGELHTGLHPHIDLPSFGYRQCVIELKDWPKTQNPANIGRIHFYVTRPMHLNLFLDRIVLLKKGEPLPPQPFGITRQIKKDSGQRAKGLEAEFADFVTKRLRPLCATIEMSNYANREAAKLTARIKALQAAMPEAGPSLVHQAEDASDPTANFSTVQAQRRLQAERLEIEAEQERLLAYLGFWRQTLAARIRPEGMLVGTATSMQLVRPRGGFRLSPAGPVSIRLARNERESFQVAVAPLPHVGVLTNVTVVIPDLSYVPKGVKPAQGDNGLVRAPAEPPAGTTPVFPQKSILVSLVGYVRTRTPPPYQVGIDGPAPPPPRAYDKSPPPPRAHTPGTGWWPDPILGHVHSADVRQGDTQAFWVTLRCPKDQFPGVYEGAIVVNAENAPAVRIPLRVRVSDFALGASAPVSIVAGFAPQIAPTEADLRDRVSKLPAAPINAWRKHKADWVAFLADHYLTYDNFHNRGMPDFEALQRLQDKGRLGLFCLGYWNVWTEERKKKEDWRKETADRIRPAYEEAKKRGMLPRAYLFGCQALGNVDENWRNLGEAAAFLRKTFPDVPIMTTVADPSYGTGSPLGSFTWFAPDISGFGGKPLRPAREAKRQVWWSVDSDSQYPYPNLYLECPPIEARLLTGLIHRRHGPNGLFLPQIAYWNAAAPIGGNPFTDWDPVGDRACHGSGQLTYAGPDGAPLSTLRLENLRDGCEDLMYIRLLSKKIKEHKPRPGSDSWLKTAEALVAIPKTLVSSRGDFSRDPALLYQWREAVSDLIEAATPSTQK